MSDRTVATHHDFGPNAGAAARGRGHPVMFGKNSAEDYGPFPDGGGYPIRFLDNAYEWLGVTNPDLVLHLCSGSMKRGVRVDIRPEMEPDFVCDARHTPFDDESWDWIMIDPPYSEEYARNLYGTEANYPLPGQLMREASRLLRPGGRVGLLHFTVPMIRRPLRIIDVKGITTGLGYQIRAFTIAEKVPAQIAEVATETTRQPSSVRERASGENPVRVGGVRNPNDG